MPNKALGTGAKCCGECEICSEQIEEAPVALVDDESDADEVLAWLDDEDNE